MRCHKLSVDGWLRLITCIVLVIWLSTARVKFGIKRGLDGSLGSFFVAR